MRKELEIYRPIAKFIAQVFGPGCEVILHDLSEIEHSIVAIENSHVTGRSVGGHITDFALSIINDPQMRKKDFVANYPGKTDHGQKTLNSSTLFIRDSEGEIIGLFCINYDVTEWIGAKKLIETFLNHDMFSNAKPEKEVEHFSSDIDVMLMKMIDESVADAKVDAWRMLPEEKKEVVARLLARGVFSIKGSVGHVAKRLGLSEQTIYRYIRESNDQT